jgi:cytoskeletal protein CcmA (bactofilin family)
MTTIGSETIVEGRIDGSEDLTVDGRVVGTINLSEILTVSTDGVVDGNVNARGVRIDGTVDGEITATEYIHLTASSRVRARLVAPIIRMDDGAKLAGEVEMDVQAPAPQTRISAPTSRPTTSVRTQPVARPVTAAPAPIAAPLRAPSASAAAPVAATSTTVTVDARGSEYDAMTVKELRDRLKNLDLAVSGTKQDLMERLADAEQ